MEMEDLEFYKEFSPLNRLLIDIFGPNAFFAEGGSEYEPIRENEAIKAEIPEVLATLTEEQESLIRYQYGFQDGTVHTDKETASYFGISEEVVKKICGLAFRTLRHPSSARKISSLRSQGKRK